MQIIIRIEKYSFYPFWNRNIGPCSHIDLYKKDCCDNELLFAIKHVLLRC